MIRDLAETTACRRLAESLALLATGDDLLRDRSLLEHLGRCARCRREVAHHRSQAGLLARLGRAQARQTAPDLWSAISARLSRD